MPGISRKRLSNAQVQRMLSSKMQGILEHGLLITEMPLGDIKALILMNDKDDLDTLSGLSTIATLAVELVDCEHNGSMEDLRATIDEIKDELVKMNLYPPKGATK